MWLKFTNWFVFSCCWLRNLMLVADKFCQPSGPVKTGTEKIWVNMSSLALSGAGPRTCSANLRKWSNFRKPQIILSCVLIIWSTTWKKIYPIHTSLVPVQMSKVQWCSYCTMYSTKGISPMSFHFPASFSSFPQTATTSFKFSNINNVAFTAMWTDRFSPLLPYCLLSTCLTLLHPHLHSLAQHHLGIHHRPALVYFLTSSLAWPSLDCIVLSLTWLYLLSHLNPADIVLTCLQRLLSLLPTSWWPWHHWGPHLSSTPLSWLHICSCFIAL